MDEVNKFIKSKRNISKNLYISHNNSLASNLPSDNTVKFKSKYAPFMIIELPKRAIEGLQNNINIEYIDLFDNNTIETETNNSIPNIRADYTQSIVLDGTGVISWND